MKHFSGFLNTEIYDSVIWFKFACYLSGVMSSDDCVRSWKLFVEKRNISDYWGRNGRLVENVWEVE